MLRTRRTFLRTVAALGAGLPLGLFIPSRAAAPPVLVEGAEFYWDELVRYFDALPEVNPGWKASRARAVVFYTLRVEYERGGEAGLFVRSRYGRRGELWHCSYLDGDLRRSKPPRWISQRR